MRYSPMRDIWAIVNDRWGLVLYANGFKSNCERAYKEYFRGAPRKTKAEWKVRELKVSRKK